jgi:hypothetical protein
VELVLVAGARGHFLALSFLVRLVTQPQYVVLPELRPTSLAPIGIVTETLIIVEGLRPGKLSVILLFYFQLFSIPI